MPRLRVLGFILLGVLWGSCVEPSLNEFIGEPGAHVDELPPVWPAGANAAVTEAGRTYVRLRWTVATDDVGVVKYPVLGDSVGEHYSTSSSILLSGLVPGRGYDLEVWAEDGAGNRTAYPLTVHASTAAGCIATQPVVPVRITR